MRLLAIPGPVSLGSTRGGWSGRLQPSRASPRSAEGNSAIILSEFLAAAQRRPRLPSAATGKPAVGPFLPWVALSWLYSSGQVAAL